MRRILIVIAALGMMLLLGCSSGGKSIEAKDINLTFSCKADVSCPSGNLGCSFSRSGPKDAVIEILSGNGKGLKWYWSGDGFTQTYCSLSAKSENCVLPEGSFASLMVKILDYAEKAGVLENTGTNSFSGSLNGCNFSLIADGNTGNLKTLSVPEWNVTVNFHDYEAETLQTFQPGTLY